MLDFLSDFTVADRFPVLNSDENHESFARVVAHVVASSRMFGVYGSRYRQIHHLPFIQVLPIIQVFQRSTTFDLISFSDFLHVYTSR